MTVKHVIMNRGEYLKSVEPTGAVNYTISADEALPVTREEAVALIRSNPQLLRNANLKIVSVAGTEEPLASLAEEASQQESKKVEEPITATEASTVATTQEAPVAADAHKSE
jgi:hypothetical protein